MLPLAFIKLTLNKLVSAAEKNDAGLYLNVVVGLFQTNEKLK